MHRKLTHRRGELTCGCQGGMAVGKRRIGSVGLADVSYYIQDVRVKNKALPYSTGHYPQHPVINRSGEEREKEDIKIYACSICITG